MLFNKKTRIKWKIIGKTDANFLFNERENVYILPNKYNLFSHKNKKEPHLLNFNIPLDEQIKEYYLANRLFYKELINFYIDVDNMDKIILSEQLFRILPKEHFGKWELFKKKNTLECSSIWQANNEIEEDIMNVPFNIIFKNKMSLLEHSFKIKSIDNKTLFNLYDLKSHLAIAINKSLVNKKLLILKY